MNAQLVQDLSAAVDRMPAFPKSVQRILQMEREGDCSPRDLVLAIEKDPVLTLKVLKTVNSSYFSLPRPIGSVAHAVVYLGFNATKHLAMAIAAIGMLPADRTGDFDWQECLLHSLSTAGIAKRLASRADVADPMDCFVAGLLHDFGKLVLARSWPLQFQRALERSRETSGDLHLALRDAVGADHAQVGAMLVEKWCFAPGLVATVRDQFGPDPDDTPMLACVYAGNQISKKLNFGFAGNPVVSELPRCVSARLGGSLEEVISSLGDLAPVFEEAKAFSRA